jgi:RNA polymerase sigma-70 factor (ECF subfamily)
MGSKRCMDKDSNSAPEGAGSDAAEDVQAHAQTVSRLFRDHNHALSSEQEARDVAQEAYVRMLELQRRPIAVGFLRAYLFKTAANLAVDRARRSINLQQLREQWVDPFEGLAQAPPAEDTAGAQQELLLIRSFLEELPQRCRDAFYLHRFQDLSVAQIGSQLQVSERMVRSYLVRALVHCRQRLDQVRGERTAETAEKDR